MKKVLEIVNKIQGILFFIVILALLIVIQFKNGSIKNLKKKLAEKPTIEYVYNNEVDTIIQEKVVPKETIVYKDKPIYIHDSIPLSSADSAQIAEAYIDVYQKYNAVNIYDDVLKDDTIAYIKLYEEVSQNAISNRKLEYLDRTPVVYITNTVTKQDKTFSIIGGMSASLGDTPTVSLDGGIVTSTNRVYTIGYDPFTKTHKGTVLFPIFNFKR